MAAPPSSRAPRAGCWRKHRPSLTFFGIFTGGMLGYWQDLVAVMLEKSQLLRRHPGALHPSPALAWPSSPATLTPTDLLLEPVCLSKEREDNSDAFICPLLKLQELCSEKSTLHMKIPDGKMKKCAVVKCAQQERNMEIPGLSFMPKLNIAMLKHTML